MARPITNAIISIDQPALTNVSMFRDSILSLNIMAMAAFMLSLPAFHAGLSLHSLPDHSQFARAHAQPVHLSLPESSNTGV